MAIMNLYDQLMAPNYQNRHFLDLDLHFIIIIFLAISYEKKARDLHTYSSIGRKSYQ